MSYEVFECLLREKGVKAYDVAKATGIASSTLTDWKKGRSTPKADKLQKIADYFEVPIDCFTSYTGQLELFPGETFAPKRSKRLEEYHKKLTPVYDVAAGEGRTNGTYATEYEDLESKEGEAWATVHGDSMLPEMRDGDKIRIQYTTEVSKTDFAVVKVDGESSTVKQVEIADNGVWIRALNKDVYEDHFFTIHEVMTLPVTIIGKVVEVRRVY